MEPNIITIFLTILIIWLIILTVILVRMAQRYQRLTAGITKKNLRELLEGANKRLESQKKATDELQNWIGRLEKYSEDHIQKVGFTRFNPFTDTGGNQSFCLTLLDQHDNGIILSSLHSREQTRIYAKSIKQGNAVGLELSKEEKETLKKAKALSKQA